MNNQQAGKLVAICTAIWPKHPVPHPEALIKAWELAMADIAYPDAERALQEYLAEGTFFPSPAEIRKLVKAAEPALDSALYQQYSRLRRQFQTGQLTDQQSRELARIERKLGIPTVTDRPVPLRAVSG